jgi:hypothetical protein
MAFKFLAGFSLISILVALFASFILYLVALSIYRLYFSPIASFPGPKYTALTLWVEFYYEVIHQGGGQFSKKIAEWHEQYGRSFCSLITVSQSD